MKAISRTVRWQVSDAQHRPGEGWKEGVKDDMV
jgi:hypothetical protein